MTEARKVLVVGAGIAGLSAAIAMAQAGIEVDVIEIQAEASTDGTGIQQPANAIRALASLGIVDEVLEHGYHWNALDFYDQGGKHQAHLETPSTLPPYPNGNGILRPRLHDILLGAATRAGATLRTGVTFTALRSHADGVDVELADGSTGAYDLVVGADGIRSSVRAATFGSTPQPAFTGEVCWRCNVPRLDEIDCISIFAAVGERAGLIPIAHDQMYIFLIESHAGDDTRIAAERVADVFRERLEDYGGPIAHVRDELLGRPEARVIYRPLETLMLAAPWYRGRVVIIGDAAHAMTPHLGQGAAQGIEDGVVLARLLAGAGSIDEALQTFMDRRFDRCKLVLDSSLQIGQWELDRASEADFVGVQRRVSEVAGAPFLDPA